MNHALGNMYFSATGGMLAHMDVKQGSPLEVYIILAPRHLRSFLKSKKKTEMYFILEKNRNALTVGWAKTWPGLVIPQQACLRYNIRGDVRGDAP